MAYVFYKNHICFFLSALKKTNTLNLYSSGSQTVVRLPLVVHEGHQGGTQIGLLPAFLECIFTKCIFTAI